jgi:hypothetical protein
VRTREHTLADRQDILRHDAVLPDVKRHTDRKVVPEIAPDCNIRQMWSEANAHRSDHPQFGCNPLDQFKLLGGVERDTRAIGDPAPKRLLILKRAVDRDATGRDMAVDGSMDLTRTEAIASRPFFCEDRSQGQYLARLE